MPPLDDRAPGAGIEPVSGVPGAVGGADDALTIPPLPATWEMGVSTDFTEDAREGVGVPDPLLIAGRAPADALDLLKQVSKEAGAVLANSDLSEQGKAKSLAALIEPAMGKLQKIEAELPKLAALRDKAMQTVAREVNGTPDAGELQRRGLIQKALLDLPAMERSKRVLAMIAEGDVSGLRAMLDLPEWMVGVHENTRAMAMEALVSATTKGSAAAAQADRARRAAENAELALASSRRFLMQMVGRNATISDALQKGGMIEKPSHAMTPEERAEYIEKHGLEKWRQLVQRSHG